MDYYNGVGLDLSSSHYVLTMRFFIIRLTETPLHGCKTKMHVEVESPCCLFVLGVVVALLQRAYMHAQRKSKEEPAGPNFFCWCVWPAGDIWDALPLHHTTCCCQVISVLFNSEPNLWMICLFGDGFIWVFVSIDQMHTELRPYLLHCMPRPNPKAVTYLTWGINDTCGRC